MNFENFCFKYGLFKGKNLIEELSFVRYFHNSKVNVYLHILGFHFLLLMVLIWLHLLWSIADIYFLVVYTCGMIIMDLPQGFVGIFAGCVFFSCDILIRLLVEEYSFRAAVLLSLLFGAIGGALQLYGHVIFDRSQPAFRAFEAFFTTPFYLYLFVFFQFGYKPKLRLEIINHTNMWKGCEKVTYGERTFSID